MMLAINKKVASAVIKNMTFSSLLITAIFDQPIFSICFSPKSKKKASLRGVREAWGMGCLDRKRGNSESAYELNQHGVVEDSVMGFKINNHHVFPIPRYVPTQGSSQ